jgi:hypothetical protein
MPKNITFHQRKMALKFHTLITDLYNMDCVYSTPCHSKSEAKKSAIFVVPHWKLLVLHQNAVGGRFSDIADIVSVSWSHARKFVEVI